MTNFADLTADPSPSKCSCGQASCVEPWELGCGLGTSAEHALVSDLPPLPNAGLWARWTDGRLDVRVGEKPADRSSGLSTPWTSLFDAPAVRDYARAAIAALQQHEWQPIDSAPKRNKHILLFGDGLAIKNCAFVGNWTNNGKGHWSLFGDMDRWVEPTHWMPLPPAPEVQP